MTPAPVEAVTVGLLDLMHEGGGSGPSGQELRSAPQGAEAPGPELLPALGVLGPISPDDLGKASTHEHMICSQLNWFIDPAHERDRDLPDLPLTLEHLGRIRRDPMSNRASLVLDDLDDVVEEVRDFKSAGGQTIVDVTNDDFGRDPEKIRHIAQETGLNIIMGSGFYLESTHPPDMPSRSLEQCAEEIIADVTVGVRKTGVRAGIIGEMGCSNDRITRDEEKALRAAALAQQETGAPVSVHPPIPFAKQALKVLDILADEGADISRVLICHMDHTLEDSAYHKAVAERGCMVEFDRFGNEWYYDSWGNWYEWRDSKRLEAIKWLIDQGHADQITVGQDICFKVCWKKYGGWGYSHLLQHVEPMFSEVGIDEEMGRKLLVDNPRRYLAFEKPLPTASVRES